MTPPLVVIVAFQSDGHLQRCLETLGRSLDVLVVDNDASDQTRQRCERLGASYLATEGNLGFAGAVNLGLARSGGRDVLLLNPDARISQQAVLELQQHLNDPRHHRAAVGPQLSNPNGKPERAWWPMPSPVQVWADALGLSHRLRGRRFVTGAVLLLRGETIAEIGGLDERYFLYAEESDWQRRAQDAGWEVAVHPTVTAEHIGGASSSDSDRRDYHFISSNRAFARRWYGSTGAAFMTAGAAIAASRRALVGPDRDAGRRRLSQTFRLERPAGWSPRPSVAHVVCTDGFAGVERSVVDIASEQHRRGWRVVVVGGDPHLMRAELPPGVITLPGQGVLRAYRSLRRMGAVDVVHAHMTKAELAAAAAKRQTGGRLVATRHFAAVRGSTSLGQLAGLVARRSIEEQISISQFVAGAVDGRSDVILNGVAGSTMTRPRRKCVQVLQRLESEKQTEVAIRAWSLSNLADQGWSMRVNGRGVELERLQRIATDLGCDTSVTFAGFTNSPREALATASIVLASAPAEPFGLTVAEAMAEGTPVVAADGGAHREVLGELGAYFAPGDPVHAAAELQRLARMTAQDRSMLGQRLQDRHRNCFTIEAQVTQLLHKYVAAAGPRVALLSLEPWDEVWRRNQHLASRLVRSGSASSLVFVTPPRGGLAFWAERHRPEPGVDVVVPPLIFPRRLGGHRLLARWLRRATAGSDLWWINDPVAGSAACSPGGPAVYDVTDDWRALDQSPRDRRRIVTAEDRLARNAEIVVCSLALADRWLERYGVHATLIGNGVDVAAIRAAQPIELSGTAPHLIYVGTAHPNRVDVALLRRIVDEMPGTVHLVGPESLDDATRAFIDARGAQRHGSVPSADVPAWLASADVLICPHLVNEFTLSLDAIKSYEYLATSAPIVATASSGFENAHADGLTVVSTDAFVNAIAAAAGTGPFDRPSPPDWEERAMQFGALLETTLLRARERAAS